MKVGPNKMNLVESPSHDHGVEIHVRRIEGRRKMHNKGEVGILQSGKELGIDSTL